MSLNTQKASHIAQVLTEALPISNVSQVKRWSSNMVAMR